MKAGLSERLLGVVSRPGCAVTRFFSEEIKRVGDPLASLVSESDRVSFSLDEIFVMFRQKDQFCVTGRHGQSTEADLVRPA
jgi:hypothetical protein